jgi:cysteine desulfurase
MFWKKKRVYLDTAAGVAGNASSPHTEGREAKRVLEGARLRIARLLEVQADDIIFTSGATEANALAILGLLKTGDHALYLPSAHASVVENMKLVATRGVEVEALPIKDARVDCVALKAMLRPETKLVSMDAVCGETGIIWNTREVKQVLGSKILLHVDASQAPHTEKITRAHFSADMLTLDISKVSAERGIGLLVAHRTIPLIPLFKGGGQERGLRSGSEAPLLAEIFARALARVQEERDAFVAKARAERARLVQDIMQNVPNVFIQEGKSQVPNIVNLSLPGRDTDYLLALLDEAGFALASRSACETDSEEGSRAVFALTKDTERAKATLRISWNAETSARDLARFVRVLAQEVAFIDSTGER